MKSPSPIAHWARRLDQAARRFAAAENGATSIEYALIVSLIFLVIIAAVKGYVNSTSEMYSDISSAMVN